MQGRGVHQDRHQRATRRLPDRDLRRLTVLVDTSALHAALDSDDEHYNSARSAFADLRTSGESLLTHNYVALETIALVQRRLGLDAVRTLIDDLLPAMDLLWIDRATHQKT